jgi:hypothetical protein
MNNFEFSNVLISTITKHSYTWYDLRFMIYQDMELKLDDILYKTDNPSEIIYNILKEKRYWTVMWDSHINIVKEVIDYIVDSIISDDVLIIVPSYVKDSFGEFTFKEAIIEIIDLVNPYSKERKRNIEIVRKYHTVN